MEDDLNIMKMEDNVNFLKMEDDLNFLKMEAGLIFIIFSFKRKMTSIYLRIEDDLKYK
jgi:hypothetical protein